MLNIIKNRYVFSLLGLLGISAFVNLGAYSIYYLLSSFIPELGAPGVEMGGLVFYLPIAIVLLIIAIWLFNKISIRVLGAGKSSTLIKPFIYWYLIIFVFNLVILPIFYNSNY